MGSFSHGRQDICEPTPKITREEAKKYRESSGVAIQKSAGRKSEVPVIFTRLPEPTTVGMGALGLGIFALLRLYQLLHESWRPDAQQLKKAPPLARGRAFLRPRQ